MVADMTEQADLIRAYRDELEKQTGKPVDLETAARLWIIQNAKKWRDQKDAMESLFRRGWFDPHITESAHKVYRNYVNHYGLHHVLELLTDPE